MSPMYVLCDCQQTHAWCYARLLQIKGLILHSPLLSVVRTRCSCLVCGPTWSSDMYANIDLIHQVHCPVYIIHGTGETISLPVSLSSVADCELPPRHTSRGQHRTGLARAVL